MAEEKLKLNIVADSFKGFEFEIDPKEIVVTKSENQKYCIVHVKAKYRRTKYDIIFSKIGEKMKDVLVPFLEKSKKIHLMIDKEHLFMKETFSATAYFLMKKENYDKRKDVGHVDVIRTSENRPNVD